MRKYLRHILQNQRTLNSISVIVLLTSLNAYADETLSNTKSTDISTDSNLPTGQTSQVISPEDAEDYSNEEDEEVIDKPLLSKNIYKYIDFPHDYLSENIEYIVTNIDAFFANEQAYKYTTDTYVQLTLDALVREGGSLLGTARLRAKADFPGTVKRIKILIETDPPEQQSTVLRSVDESPDGKKDYYATIEKPSTQESGWSIKPSLGIKLVNPPDPFGKFLVTQNYLFDPTFKLRFEENLYWYTASGYGSDTLFEFNKKLLNGNLIRASSFIRYTEKAGFFTFSQVFDYYQTLDSTRKISYQGGAYASSYPTYHITSYLFLIRYRQQLYKKWLYYELRPQVFIPQHGEPELSFLIRLDMIFGAKYI